MKFKQLMKPQLANKLANTLFKDTKLSLSVLNYYDALVKNVEYLNLEIAKINNADMTGEEKKIQLEALSEDDILVEMPKVLIRKEDFENSIASNDTRFWLSPFEIRDIIKILSEN